MEREIFHQLGGIDDNLNGDNDDEPSKSWCKHM